MAPAPTPPAQIDSVVESGLDSTQPGGGFTPQAEIWNGRLAMLGLSIGLGVLLVSRLVASQAPA